MSKTRSFAIDVCSVARGLESSIECLSERDSLGGCSVCAGCSSVSRSLEFKTGLLDVSTKIVPLIFEELFSVCLNCRYGTYLGDYGDG